MNPNIADRVETDAPVSMTRTFRVWSVDAWGNDKDGYEVNDRASAGYIDLCESMTNTQLLLALEDAGFLKPDSHTVGTIEGEWDYTLYIGNGDTDQPWLQLENNGPSSN